MSLEEEQREGQENPRAPSWMDKKINKIRWRIHATFPNSMASPYGDETAYLNERDEKENLETRIPVAEELRMPAIWGVEIFGPAEIESLYEQLRRLKWDAHPSGSPDHAPIRWVKESRIYGGTGYLNIGVVKRPGSSNMASRHTGPVPKGVDYLLVKIFQISPAITCVVVGFKLTENYSSVFERELLTDRKTVRRPIFGKFTYQMLGPELLKREAIDRARRRHRDMVVGWFRKNLRGFSYSTSKGLRLPTAELLTSKHHTIMGPLGEEIGDNGWANLLVPFAWSNIWVSTKYKGLRLRHSDLSSDIPSHTIVTLQTSNLPEEEFTRYGGQSPSNIVAFVHELVEHTYCHHAALAMLQEISRTLKESREKLKIEGRSYRKLFRSIDAIKLFFDRSLGFPIILSDLHKKSESLWQYKQGCHEFSTPSLVAHEVPEKLSESLCAATKRISERVQVEEAIAREHFQQIASILSTRESVKTQRRMAYLTVFALVLTFGSLLVSLSPDSWLKTVKAFFESRLGR